jgi:hypothetical protein
VKYYDHPGNFIDKAAASLTVDVGCEWGGYESNGTAVDCGWGNGNDPSQFFIGFMAYNRIWFDKDQFGFTVGGGAINNPGRYLVLLPPINGATAASGTPYFTENPGDQFKAWDMQVTLDYMPIPFVTFRAEYTHRAASVPYFEGHGGVTPPGGNTGDPGGIAYNPDGSEWYPNLVNTEDRFTLALLVKM